MPQVLRALLGALCALAVLEPARGLHVQSAEADLAVVAARLDREVYSALIRDTGCLPHAPKVHTARAAYQKVAKKKALHLLATPSERCSSLCKGKKGCVDVCEEVRTMICDQSDPSMPSPAALTVSSDSTASAAAAAAAAATNAVQTAVRDAIDEAARSAKEAAAETRAAIKDAVKQAEKVAKSAAHDAASQAAQAAGDAAAREAAASAHAIASTAAAAATAAASASIKFPAPAAAPMPLAAAPAPGPAAAR